jgi:hypothetical protein
MQHKLFYFLVSALQGVEWQINDQKSDLPNGSYY